MMFSRDLGVKFLISGVNLKLWPVKGQNTRFGHKVAIYSGPRPQNKNLTPKSLENIIF